jgi:hypothetical protein
MIATIILMTSLISTITFATGRVLEPSGFQSNGDHIADWYWLRANGHTATWTFDVADLNAARPGSVYLNFAPLITNRANGGSGHDVVCKVNLEGALTRILTIPLNNPFRPIDPESSGGIGYQSFGHSATPIPAALFQGADRITVRVSYPFSPNYHLAVKRDALTIGYSR